MASSLRSSHDLHDPSLPSLRRQHLLFALATSGGAQSAKLAFAGDARRQILRPTDAHVDPYAVARECVPDRTHVALKRGLRQVSGLTGSAEGLLSRRFGYRSHRVTSTIDGSLVIKQIPDAGGTSHALAEALREMLERHQAHDIAILSTFGARNSLVGRLLAAEHFSKEESWLRERRRLTDDVVAVDLGRVDAVTTPVTVDRPAPTRRWQKRHRVGCGGDRSASTRGWMLKR